MSAQEQTLILPGYEGFSDLKEKHRAQRRTETIDATGRTFRRDGQTWTVVATAQVGRGRTSYTVYRAAPQLPDGSLGKMETIEAHKVELA